MMKKSNEKNKYSLKISIIVILLMSIMVCFLTYYIRERHLLGEVVRLWLVNPLSFVVNVLPIFALGLLILGISSRLNVSVVLTSAIFLLLAYINDQKLIYREEPIVLADIYNIKEAFNMVSGFGFGLSFKLLVSIFIIVIYLYFLGLVTRRIRIRRKTGLKVFSITLVISFILLNTLYSSEAVYESFPRTVENETNIAQSYKDKGFIYSAIYHRDSHRILKPDSYDPAYKEEILEDFTYQDPGQKPHLVMVMGEAWTDISKYLDFKPGYDPFVHGKETMDQAFNYGHLIASSFGGGTANTEYDSLTGSSTLRHSEGILTSYSTIKSPRTSIARVFKDNGYNTVAIHPGESWFYNRKNVFDYLGFDESHFKEDMENPTYKGGFPSEKDLTDFIIDQFEAKSKDGPVFEYVVTIQNHSPYDINKYGYVDDTIINTHDLDPKTLELYEAYFMGIRDMDKQIKVLRDYFEKIQEPVVFIYYGDHLPYLNANYQAFKDVGMEIDRSDYRKIQDIYKTPFFFWGNQAYMESFDPGQESYYISANYLASLALRSAGLEGTHPFYQYLDDLMEAMPIIFKYFYLVQEDGRYVLKQYEDLDQEDMARLAKFDSLNYMMAKDPDMKPDDKD